jgi:diadenosine tetraphosphate (Ap4A) HIT family hydrolase
MASIFTQIIEGKLPGHFVWKDELAVAFMTIQPINDGHLLVIPRQEIDHWDDLPADLAAHLMLVAQRIARGLKEAFPCKRVGLIIAGLEVPHTHIHLMPVNELTDFDFSRAKNLDSSALESSAEKIRKVLKAQGHQEAG